MFIPVKWQQAFPKKDAALNQFEGVGKVGKI
jgi:hypothetical protein